MKSTALIILITITSIGCSVKRLTLTPKDSERGDAVFGLIVPNNNYAKLEDIHIFSWTQGGILNVNRVLIDFNLNSIPNSANIDRAFLNLYFNNTSAYDKVLGSKGNQGEDSIIIQRVISDWNEKDVTWNKQPNTSTTNQVVIAKLNNPRANYLKIDVTEIIKDMASCNNCRYGILLKHKNEKPYNVAFFASSNHPNKKLHPKLKIHYSKQ